MMEGILERKKRIRIICKNCQGRTLMILQVEIPSMGQLMCPKCRSLGTWAHHPTKGNFRIDTKEPATKPGEIVAPSQKEIDELAKTRLQ